MGRRSWRIESRWFDYIKDVHLVNQGIRPWLQAVLKEGPKFVLGCKVHYGRAARYGCQRSTADLAIERWRPRACSCLEET